ncbi:MAG: hypothetical protein H6729_13285 [Deltaproteobacteria bacterium]|nr:hypothetical protein [Deltaproteobacteria bacterium]
MQARRIISNSIATILVLEIALALTAITMVARATAPRDDPGPGEPNSQLIALPAAKQAIAELTWTASTSAQRDRILETLDRVALASIKKSTATNGNDKGNTDGPGWGPELRAGKPLGAWAAVIMGLVVIAITVVVWRRINLQLMQPLAMINDVIAAATHGDPHRRCTSGAAQTLSGLAERVNELLDRISPREPRRNLARLDRALLLNQLDQHTRPTVAVTVSGEVVVANQAGLRLLERDEGRSWMDKIRGYVTGHPDDVEGLSIVEVSKGELWLVEIESPSLDKAE